jgi:Excalibur calcium-binding domain
MLRTAKTSLIVVAMTASTLAFAGPAEAVTDFAGCGAMHRTFKNGVAKSHAAAHRQERTGHQRPAVRPAIYRANKESDADKDGTACEVVDR